MNTPLENIVVLENITVETCNLYALPAWCLAGGLSADAEGSLSDDNCLRHPSISIEEHH